jgi:hypothetical protein
LVKIAGEANLGVRSTALSRLYFPFLANKHFNILDVFRTDATFLELYKLIILRIDALCPKPISSQHFGPCST